MNYAISYPVKECYRCGLTKPLTEHYFAPRSRKYSRTGFKGNCRECVAAYQRQYKIKNWDKITEKQREHYYKNHEYELEYQRRYRVENAEILRKKKQEYYQRNRADILASRREFYYENKERIQDRQRRYMKTEEGKKIDARKRSRRRVLEAFLVNDLSESEWEECLEFFDNSCAYCGDSEGSLHKEHFIPVGDGGGTTSSNIVPSCASCNSSKFTKDFFEWYPTHKAYSVERMEKVVSYISSRMRGEEA